MDGIHFVLDAKNVSRGKEVLRDDFLLADFLVEICSRVGLTPLEDKPRIYHLPADESHSESGMTALYPLKESHISVHTFSEVEGFALDIFSCKKFLFKDALDFVMETFGKADYLTVSFERKL